MRRREFVTLVGGAAISWPTTSHAQQSDKTRLIGVLMGYAESDPAAQSEVAALRSGLRAGVDGRQQGPDRTSLWRR